VSDEMRPAVADPGLRNGTEQAKGLADVVGVPKCLRSLFARRLRGKRQGRGKAWRRGGVVVPVGEVRCVQQRRELYRGYLPPYVNATCRVRVLKQGR